MSDTAILDFGCEWIITGDDLDSDIVNGVFEESDVAFVKQFLKPGMHFLDIGAHHGYYTLLAASLVGPSGIIMAYEPSPHAFSILTMNAAANKFQNVICVHAAIGTGDEIQDLYCVGGKQSGLNSLRPPVAKERVTVTHTEVLPVPRLHFDLVKIDAEGAELSILQSSPSLTDGADRPVILFESQDERTSAWGYSSMDLVQFLEAKGFSIFETRNSCIIARAKTDGGNMLAIPPEHREAVNA